MFSFLNKKKPTIPADFSALSTDLHSHLIPGIDDGSPDMETSLRLIREMREMGFRKIITTPHVMGDLYPNSSAIILEGLQEVRAALLQEGSDVELFASAEYHLDENFDRLLESDDLLPLPGKRLLIELSFFGEPPGLEATIFKLRTKGYKPILAHIERYAFYIGKLDKVERIKDMGCDLQVNIGSITGHYGGSSQRWAAKLIKEGWIDYLATDLHHQGHIELLKKALSHNQVRHILNHNEFKNKQLTE